MSQQSDYALAKLGPGGLLLDLRSGGLFELNESATFIWERWLAGRSSDDVATNLAEAYALPLGVALEDVRSALASRPTDEPPKSEFLYQRAGDRFVFSRAGVPVLHIEDSGEALALARPSALSEAEIKGMLVAISPKLLALRGHFVLHASAVSLSESLLALCGESGAGKTTAARALVRAGAFPFCEDKLVVRRSDAAVEVLRDVEAQIEAWSWRASADLARGRSSPAPRLEAGGSERFARLNEIALIDAGRRDRDRIRPATPSVLQTARGLFRNSFYGSDAPGDWSRQLDMVAAIVMTIGVWEVTMPDGLASLETAAAELVRSGSIRSAIRSR